MRLADEVAFLLGIRQNIRQELKVGILGFQGQMRYLSLVPVLYAADMEMGYIPCQGEELIDETFHVRLGLQISVQGRV